MDIYWCFFHLFHPSHAQCGSNAQGCSEWHRNSVFLGFCVTASSHFGLLFKIVAPFLHSQRGGVLPGASSVNNIQKENREQLENSMPLDALGVVFIALNYL